ncbi:hypothetical protein BH24ACT6_BH24ACT6_03100 [soil metagenome]
MPFTYEWRGAVTSTELNALHAAGCEYLFVDFEDELRPFYIDACGFRPASAGLLALASREHHPTLDPDRLRADIDAVIDPRL